MHTVRQETRRPLSSLLQYSRKGLIKARTKAVVGMTTRKKKIPDMAEVTTHGDL